MQIIEADAQRVMANLFQPDNANMAPARHNHLLPRPMALHFRTRAFHAQIFGGQRETRTISEGNFQDFFRLAQADFRGCAHASNLRASSGSIIGMPSRTG